MPYKTIQNSTWSNGQIKKSTFWLYPVRVLVLIAINWIFKLLWLLIHHSNMLYLFLSLLDLKFMILHLFQFFDLFYFTFFFCLCFDVWIEIGQNTVSPPAWCTNILQINLKQLVSCQWCTDNFVIFYVRKFWRMLHIYYKQKVN